MPFDTTNREGEMRKFFWWVVLALVAVGLLWLFAANSDVMLYGLTSFARLLPAWMWWLAITVLAAIGWIARPFPTMPTNIWSYLFCAPASILLAVAMKGLVAWTLSHRLGIPPDWATAIGWVIGIPFGGAFFWTCLEQKPIPPGFGAAAKFLGFLLPFRLRTGGNAWSTLPGFGISELVDRRLYATPEVSIEAMAPDFAKMRAKISLMNKRDDPRRFLLYAGDDPDQTLLNKADEALRKVIVDRTKCGETAIEVASEKANIQTAVQEAVNELAGRMGMISDVLVREILPPESIMTAAARKEEERQEAIAQAIESEGLTARVTKFAADNQLTRQQAIAYLQVEGQKATRLVFTPEGVDQVVELIKLGLEAIAGRRN